MATYITTQAAMLYYMLAMQSGDREVGGQFEFYTDTNGNDVITDLHVMRQSSTSTYFEIDEVEKALWLEKIVGDGKDPANFGLFHTHPSGMGASMSGVDVRHLHELAKDLPGVMARSMIISQGQMNPTMHEALYVNGRVFVREDVPVHLFDHTGAKEMLDGIGWFDKPKPKAIATSSNNRGYYQAGVERSALGNDSWFDQMPEVSEDDGWLSVIDGGEAELFQEDLIKANEEAESWIGETVVFNGNTVGVVDAYDWYGDVVLVLPDNSEVTLDEVTTAR